MIAIGTGAETAIEDQIRAAGMNLIVVTAGNYKVKSTEDFGGGAVGALRGAANLATHEPSFGDDLGSGPALVTFPCCFPSRRRSDGEAQSSDGEAAAGRQRSRARVRRDADRERTPRRSAA